MHRPNAEGVALLRRTLEYITTHPLAHDQTCWLQPNVDSPELLNALEETGLPQLVELDPAKPACGTVGCLAGNAVLLSGRYPIRLVLAHSYLAVQIQIHDGNPDEDEWRDVDLWTQDVAVDLLDLSPKQADIMFEEARTVGELWVLAQLFTDDAIQPPTDVVHPDDYEVAKWYRESVT